ncbi:MAG: hypothetical protein ACFB4I_07565 [Cyanophyceae cyanobacterium]
MTYFWELWEQQSRFSQAGSLSIEDYQRKLTGLETPGELTLD